MPEYLYTARNPDGRKVTERLEALSADSVVQMLRDRGYAEIVLHTDDVSALYTRQSEVDEHISPREYVALRRFKGYHPAHILFLVRKLFSWKLFAVALVLLVIRCFVRVPWGPLDHRHQAKKASLLDPTDMIVPVRESPGFPGFQAG